MKKVGIFYGPQGGSTEKVALQIAEQFGGNAELKPVKGLKAADVNAYDNIVFGVATLGRETWNSEIKGDWDVFFPELDKIEVAGKTFAIFGLGDHLTYANQFVDAMGHVGAKLLERGAKVVGKCATCEYTFNESEAVIEGQFIGLPIDEIFEKEKTEERIKDWTVRLKNKFE
jgi:flavodoxin I